MPPDLEPSTLGPTLGRLRADQKPHYVPLVDRLAGVVRRRTNAAAAIERAGGGWPQWPLPHRADYRLAIGHGVGHGEDVTSFQLDQAAAQEIRAVWAWLREALAVPDRSGH